VIIDSGTYKCWYTGNDGTNDRVIYCEGPDGINWSSFQLAININAEGTYDTTNTSTPSVIKDSSTYKCWYTGNNGTNSRIIYCDSSDGITWINHQLVIDISSEGVYDINQTLAPSVIKDSSTYKCWCTGYDGSNYKIIYTTSTDGKNWIKPVLFMNSNTEGYKDTLNVSYPCIIKDDDTYKIWYTGNNEVICHAILTMTDTSNTGSSLLGVYATEGTQNFAPGTNDSVLVIYEHRANQFDISKFSGSDPNHTLTYILKYLDDNAIITSLGTTGSPVNYPSDYRDVISTLYPSIVDTDSSQILLYNQSQYNEDDILTLKDFVKYVFINNTFPKVGDYISLASLDMNSINGINVYVTDNNYNAFGSGNISVEKWSGGNASIIISGVGEKNKELFIPITFTTGEISDSDPVCNDVILINAIGRPIVR